jgi:hypothetical protein
VAAALGALSVSIVGGQPAPPTRASAVSGELRQWHKVTLTVDGPQADEAATDPNPFRDYRMTVRFTHESGAPAYNVPGYFAADGNAANTSARTGNKWRAHLSPDKAGRWNWRVTFVSGKDVALDPTAAGDGRALAPFDGLAGSFQVAATNKTAPDFRASGRLEYAGGHHLRFAASGEYFLKVGTDSPETLLAYADFDDTTTGKPQVPVKTYQPHLEDWAAGDPVWKEGKGKGLIGAVNYLASKKVNAMSFLTYNAGGDGDNVWPFVSRDDKFHYDVSRLDQWQIVFDHAQRKGIYLHFKLQETENDDNVRGNPGGGRAGTQTAARGGGAPAEGGRGPGQGRGGPQTGPIVESLDGGDLGLERRLYLRELIARFGYALALNWNLGEENTQSAEQQRAMAGYIVSLDPYRHHTVLHTYPDAQESVYPPLLGDKSALTGASVQTGWSTVHERTVRWIGASARAGKPWVVANDEQGPSGQGAPPDPGYPGFTGKDAQGKDVYTIHDIRKLTLWGNLMAGGAGVEYYFGYSYPENDLVAQDFRSRDKTWDYGRIALEFFRSQKVPFWTMTNADGLVGNAAHDNTRWCLARAGDLYLVYLPAGGTADLDLAGTTGQFSVQWFDPRAGGALERGSVTSVKGGGPASLGTAPDSPAEDWLIVVRR